MESSFKIGNIYSADGIKEILVDISSITGQIPTIRHKTSEKTETFKEASACTYEKGLEDRIPKNPLEKNTKIMIYSDKHHYIWFGPWKGEGSKEYYLRKENPDEADFI